MLETQQHTRDKILSLGRSYIQQVGYHAFNYKQISTKLNIKNAAIHYYYPAKEDLAVAIIQKDHADFKVRKKTLAAQSPLDNLEALLNDYSGYCDEGKLCIVGTFEASAPELSEKVKSATAVYLDELFLWLRDTMQAGLDKGHFHFKQTATELAELWLATLPGALMAARIRGKKVFKVLSGQLKDSLAMN